MNKKKPDKKEPWYKRTRTRVGAAALVLGLGGAAFLNKRGLPDNGVGPESSVAGPLPTSYELAEVPLAQAKESLRQEMEQNLKSMMVMDLKPSDFFTYRFSILPTGKLQGTPQKLKPENKKAEYTSALEYLEGFDETAPKEKLTAALEREVSGWRSQITNGQRMDRHYGKTIALPRATEDAGEAVTIANLGDAAMAVMRIDIGPQNGPMHQWLTQIPQMQDLLKDYRGQLKQIPYVEKIEEGIAIDKKALETLKRMRVLSASQRAAFFAAIKNRRYDTANSEIQKILAPSYTSQSFQAVQEYYSEARMQGLTPEAIRNYLLQVSDIPDGRQWLASHTEEQLKDPKNQIHWKAKTQKILSQYGVLRSLDKPTFSALIDDVISRTMISDPKGNNVVKGAIVRGGGEKSDFAPSNEILDWISVNADYLAAAFEDPQFGRALVLLEALPKLEKQAQREIWALAYLKDALQVKDGKAYLLYSLPIHPERPLDLAALGKNMQAMEARAPILGAKKDASGNELSLMARIGDFFGQLDLADDDWQPVSDRVLPPFRPIAYSQPLSQSVIQALLRENSESYIRKDDESVGGISRYRLLERESHVLKMERDRQPHSKAR